MQKYWRFITGLRKFAKSRMQTRESLRLAQIVLRQRIIDRERNFLNLVEKGIFHYAHSPYLQLLEFKKIKCTDLKAWVSRDGLESTLRKLASEGIYFTVDEFKGRVPVVRNGLRFQCNERMFDNPFLSEAYEVRSGATRSVGTRIRIDFEYLHQRALYDALLLDTHGCLTAPVANWFPVFPGAPGINSSLRFAHIGNPVQRWFSQVSEDQLKINWEKKLGTKLLFAVSKLYGAPLAEPEYVQLSNAQAVAKWASQMLTEHPACVIYTFAGSALRICMAAAEMNLDLKGVRFFVTGEPLTPQKRHEIESTGALVVPVYGISEAGVVAAGCNRRHLASDHCHLYKDTTAVIHHKYHIPRRDLSIDSYLFTTVLFESPKLLLNVGMGDYGDISLQKCDCAFAELGFDTSVSSIRSYEKLTGEGVTFVETDFIRIIEKDLPESFGGRSTDYQLLEQEDSKGITELRLLISPRIGVVPEEQVLNRFMTLLTHAEDSWWAQSGTEMWKQCRMVQVSRKEPITTASGKILPFYLIKPDTGTHGSALVARS